MNGDYIAALDIRLCLRYTVIKAAQPRPLPPDKYFALFALQIWLYTKLGIDPIYSVEEIKLDNLLPALHKLNVAFIGGINQSKGGEEILKIVTSHLDVNWFIMGGLGVGSLKTLRQQEPIR